ncbi:MAG: hypothetical protein ABEK16_00740 [Candidatus Nanohalobium sp.]
MKGQTQAVTAVMITGVIIGGIASAYVWGVPLVEKRQAQAELDSVESSVLELQSSIVSVARSGQGSSGEVKLSLENGKVQVNSTGNYIDVTVFSSSAPYAAGTWSMLRGQSRQGLSIGAGSYGIQGENSPGVVAVRKVSSASSAVTYRVEFRNLLTTTASSQELRLIDIQSAGSPAAAGEVTVEFTNDGRRFDTGGQAYELPSGEMIDRRRVVVEVDLR